MKLFKIGITGLPFVHLRWVTPGWRSRFLAPRITDVSVEPRKQLRLHAKAHGLSILGLHWLLAKTEGFMVTSPGCRGAKTNRRLPHRTGPPCRDMGGDILVFGSPMQRKIPAGATRVRAEDYAVDTFSTSCRSWKNSKFIFAWNRWHRPRPTSANGCRGQANDGSFRRILS